MSVFAFLQFSPELDTRGITMSSVIGGQPPSLQLSNNEKDTSSMFIVPIIIYILIIIMLLLLLLLIAKQHSSTTTKTESSSKKTSHSANTPSFTARKANYASHEIKTKERRKLVHGRNGDGV